jgi:hypothetical protein
MTGNTTAPFISLENTAGQSGIDQILNDFGEAIHIATTSSIYVRHGGAGIATLTNISVKEILLKHSKSTIIMSRRS